MSKVIYLTPRRRRHPLVQFMVDDWRCTCGHLRALRKLLRDYRAFRGQRFTRRAAFFLARNSI